MPKATTQSFIPIKEIREGVIIREDGVLCSIILVSSINFDLKSQVEREAILFQFQSMLNSLEVAIEILVQSRKLNIKPYIQYLDGLHKSQSVELLKLQTREYIGFIKEFTERHEIVSKQFFVITTYSPTSTRDLKFSLKPKKSKKSKESDERFEENKSQLLQRTSYLQNNIRSLGLRAVQLGTEEITELLYQTFNPGDTQTPPTHII